MPRVIWITGLSGSGKTSLAYELSKKLQSQDEKIVVLDGDELREVFGTVEFTKGNHNRETRLELSLKYSRLCQLISSQGLTVIIATISMFKEVYAWNRQHLQGYFQVYLNASLDVLRSRDPKGIYSDYLAGKLENVAGLDLKVDEPYDSDIIFDVNNDESSRQLAEKLIGELTKNKIR